MLKPTRRDEDEFPSRLMMLLVVRTYELAFVPPGLYPFPNFCPGLALWAASLRCFTALTQRHLFNFRFCVLPRTLTASGLPSCAFFRTPLGGL